MNSKNSLRRLLNDALGRRKEHGRRGKHRRLALETPLEVRAMLTPTTHFHADFSAAGGAPSLDGFTIENSIGAPVDGLWHLSTGRGNDPGHSSDDSMYFGTGETITGGGTYDVGHTAGRITSPFINSIPAGAVLSFSYFLQTENAGGFDVPNVFISANSGAFNIQSITLNQTAGGFQIASLDLSAFRGQSIQVRFEFNTTDTQNNSFEGWYVDDVMVTTGTRNIQGTVFNDVNDNDIPDGDPGFPDTRVFIDDDNDGVYDTDYFVRNPSNATPVSIPDVSTVTSIITIGGSALELVRDVNVTLDITHSFDADLDVFLIAPNGTRVELFTDVGSGVEDFTSTTLDDDASTSITSGTAPFTGTFRPEGSLAVLNGIGSAGTWTLEISDDSGSDTGTLNSWSLQLGVTREFQNTTSIPIPDETTITSPISVSGTTGYIQDIDVQLNISHELGIDLAVFLIAPNGVRVELFTDTGVENFSQTILDDEAATGITGGAPPYTGRFRPEGLLSAFDGYTANGIWQLEVTDDRSVFVGTLNSWSLSLTIGERTDITDAIGNYDIPVTEVGNSFRVRAATPTGFFPTAPSTGEQLVTVAPEASTVTGVSFGSQRPDFRMISATGNGGTGISITYEITNGDIASVSIDIYQSSDALFDVGDTFVTGIVPAPADLTVGIHTVNLVLGVDIVLPGAGITDLNTDYRLLFSADRFNDVDEPDIDPSNEDNTVAFTGVYHQTGGPVMAFGFNTADTLTVAPNGLNVEFDFDNASMSNPLQTSYPVADVTQFRLRGAGGDDNFSSGANNDTMSIPLAIWGGAGLDTIQGGDGNDMLSGGADNDLFVFFPSENVESDTVEEAPGVGRDTIDFSQLSTAVTLNLGLTTPQAVNANRTLTLTSATGLEDATGGSAADTLTGNSNANQLFGFGGGDTLNGGGGSDTLLGGLGDDSYIFAAATAAEADTLTEGPGGGVDTISFATISTPVTFSLATGAVQPVHTNRTIRLNSTIQFENVAGGTGNDILSGNTVANLLNGNAGGDTLNGAAGSDSLLGGLGDDNYVFSVPTSAEADTLTEGAGGGVDTISFATITTPVTFSLGTGAVQSVHTNRTVRLNSTIQFENAAGGSSNDVLTGNTVANLLNGNAGSDTLNGAGGSDTLLGGLGDDTYVFSPATAAEADTLTEGAGGGVDTISFATITTPVTFSLGTGAVQSVHTNRTLRLNSTIQFENAAGGSAADTLTGNTVANILIGNAGGDTLNGLGGRDILIGGLGLDTLNGGDDEDILIAGRTASDALFSNLNRMQQEWTSGNSYTTRITNLRAGVGSPAVSLKAKVNVRNDAGEDDSLIGGNSSDWYFRALDDVITGLVAGEVLDVL